MSRYAGRNKDSIHLNQAFEWLYFIMTILSKNSSYNIKLIIKQRKILTP